MTASTWVWIAAGGFAWLVVALVVGITVGKVVRARDRQRPDTPTRRCLDQSPHAPHTWRPFALECPAYCPGKGRGES